MDLATKVVSSAHGEQYCVFDGLPVVQDGAVTDPEHDEALAKQLEVSSPVDLVTFSEMMSAAVELEHEAISNENIHEPDPRN